VTGADGAEQLAFVTGVRLDGDDLALQRVGARLRGRQLFLGLAHQFGAALLEFLHVLLRGRHGLGEGEQVVARITGLDVDLIANVADAAHFFQQYNVHFNLAYLPIRFLKSKTLSIRPSTITNGYMSTSVR